MAKKNMVPAYTTTWGYTASSIIWLFEKGDWKATCFEKKEPYCISEGIKLMMIISMASVIEGALRSHLRSKINNAQKRKEELGEYFKKEDSDSTAGDFRDIEEVEVDELPFILDTDFRKEYVEHVNLLKRGANAKKVKGIKKMYYYLKNTLCSILPKSSSDLTSVEYEKLNIVLESIEESAWRDLKLYYDKINTIAIKAILKDYNSDLLRDINMLFSFRNFVVHGKRIDIKFDETAANIQYDNDSLKLVNYLKEKKFYPSSVKNKYIIECLLPDEVITHFKTCMLDFLKSPVFKGSSETQNSINMIWEKGRHSW